MAGKSMIAEHIQPVRKEYVEGEVEAPITPKDPHEFRASLKELFVGLPPVTRTKLEEGVQLPRPHAMVQYAKDPVLNKILNETTSDLRQRERMTGLAAFNGGYNPGQPATGPGPMMPEAEMPAFARGMPNMPAPVSHAPVIPREGQDAPLAAISEGVSALDIARAGMTTPAVTEALTNYDRMKKILEASKGRR